MIRDQAAAPRRDVDGIAGLSGVIDTIDRDLMWPLTGSLGLDAVVTGPVFLTPEHPGIHAGAVVLGVGLEQRGRLVIDALRQCATARAAALALKLPPGVDADPATVAFAQESGVALLAVRPDLAWGQLFVLLRTAVARTGGLLAAADVSVPAGDLFGLAVAIADAVGGAVTIEDPRFNVLAYSRLDEPVDELRLQAILTRRTSDEWIRRLNEVGAIDTLWSTPGVVRVDSLTKWGLRPRLAIAVRAGQEILGSIWVAEGNRPLLPSAEAALESAAAGASLHLLRHRASEDLERTVKSQLLGGLLEGGGSVEMAAARLNLELDGEYTVVAFDLEAGDEPDRAARRERMLDLVNRYWTAFRRPVVCAATAGAVYALLPGGPTFTRDRVLAACEGALEHLSSALRVPVWAGIGATVRGLEAVTRSRRDADQVLRTLDRTGGGPRFEEIEAVRTRVFLIELERLFAKRPDLMAGKLQKLIEHDERHRTSYVESVAAYLDAFGHVSAAAEAVVVHSKSFRYRLRRVKELAGLDFDDPRDRLLTHLQLRSLRGQRN